MRKELKVVFKPDNRTVKVEPATTVLDAATSSDIYIDSICGGRGKCGKCKVLIEGTVQTVDTDLLTATEKAGGYFLACLARVAGNLKVTVPKESRVESHQILMKSVIAPSLTIDPPVLKVPLSLTPPSLADYVSDLDRVTHALRSLNAGHITIGLPTLQKLSRVLRENEWNVNVTLMDLWDRKEIIDIGPHSDHELIGIAIDIGTTTIVVELVDLKTGRVIDARSDYNKQVVYGEDVLSRVLYTEEHADGINKLTSTIRYGINDLIRELVIENDMRYEKICRVVLSGNTVMMHLFYGLDPKYIRHEPYIPVMSFIPQMKAVKLGLSVNPNAYIYALPCRSSYVGGDVTADIIASGMSDHQDVSLLIDVGTNGEVVLGSNAFLVSCSCSAGPAFEGGEVEFGVRAMNGAIERVWINDGVVEYSTIGNGKAKGICGSGLIELIAELFSTGVIDRTGKIQQDNNNARIQGGSNGNQFIVAFEDDTAIDKNIVLTDVDIQNILRTKAAVYASCSVLLKTFGYKFNDLSNIFIAGSFGNYLDVKKAITIGLLPDLPLEKFKFIGNGALGGARMVLLSRGLKDKAAEIVENMTHIELSVSSMFFKEFTSALFIPHTELDQFPHVATRVYI
ncbi:MAG TPA: ASKHA domain-containing protein [Candidatus Bathyarchaeia archaeon]|nr:ASKHA domain-containing protein [Candidatus Bathyarchaeia archaeon]